MTSNYEEANVLVTHAHSFIAAVRVRRQIIRHPCNLIISLHLIIQYNMQIKASVTENANAVHPNN